MRDQSILIEAATDYIRRSGNGRSCSDRYSSSTSSAVLYSTMASAPDTTSIPGYTIFREGDYDSVAATAMLPQGKVHPLGMISMVKDTLSLRRFTEHNTNFAQTNFLSRRFPRLPP